MQVVICCLVYAHATGALLRMQDRCLPLGTIGTLSRLQVVAWLREDHIDVTELRRHHSVLIHIDVRESKSSFSFMPT